jgi:L-fuconolactonase
MIIDAHQHFWDKQLFNYDWLNNPDVKLINKSYLPHDLEQHLKFCGIDRSVFVQVQHSLEENRWVLKLAEENNFIAGVVGWVDLQSPNVEQQLLEFKDHPKFVGIRHVVQDEPDDDFIIRPAVLNGLKILEKHHVPYDLLFYTKHLKHAVTVAQYCPELPFVIDHLSKPKIKTQDLGNWETEIKAAAKYPNMFCKISGMVTEADHEHWKSSDMLPFFDIVVESFGPERLMYGSDWPVCELAANYEEVYGLFQELVFSLSPTERQQIAGQTAINFYKLNIT